MLFKKIKNYKKTKAIEKRKADEDFERIGLKGCKTKIYNEKNIIR